MIVLFIRSSLCFIMVDWLDIFKNSPPYKSSIINQRAAGRDADEGKKTLTSTGRNKRLG